VCALGQFGRYVSMSRGRIIIAFLIAPLMTPLVFTIFEYLNENSPLFLAYGIVAYLAVIILGIPAFFFYRELKWTNVFLFILGGAVIGFIVSLFLFESYPLEYFLQFLEERIWCVVAGALSALVFRLILFGLKFDETKRGSIEGET
jgi:hypothetical protein